ncbi:disintegrin and metalloproteinase domain-containing protein unc-71-like isoform X6 [Mytilus trossulus]|uniref:disintegrin and metalloproteinase domain-containing protein unc-71-like isoform X6 n=1 Tax=Mytilus trossulus TaxID=6551 RepID=UPI003004690F
MGFILFLFYGIVFVQGIPGVNSDSDIAKLLEHPYNKYLWDNIPRPFEIIFPKRVHKKADQIAISTREKQIRHHGTHEHLEHVTFQLMINGQGQKLRLKKNDALLSSGIQVKHYLEENQQIISKTVEHCYYQGTVKRDEWSSVAVSTCHGIRGVINLHNKTYVIQPLLGGDEGIHHPHVVFKASTSKTETCGNDIGQWRTFQELHRGEFIRRVKAMKAKKQLHMNVNNNSEKHLKMALVLDNSVYSRLNLSHKEMVNFALQTANMVDMYVKDVGIRTPVTYLEYWNAGDKMEISSQIRELLKSFLMYKQFHLMNIDHHAAHFITHIPLEDNSVGLAIPDSVCTERAVGINRVSSVLEPQQLATILTHMLGHNLGLKHDEDGGCDCKDQVGCIMSTDVLMRSDTIHSRQFSYCSRSDLDVSTSMDITACLSASPKEYYISNVIQMAFTQECGNLIVERGEECDCGTPQECAIRDPCCDPDTCLLKTWAQCRTGSCCYNCTFLPQQYVCRERSTECDVPELCTGFSGECPSNNYIQDGHPCKNSSGFCQSGICPTMALQCQHIWGEGAIGADEQCYERFNPIGNFNGHCGKDDNTGSYAKCLPENIMCGLLHCDGGTVAPLFGSDKNFMKTTLVSNGIEYACKVIHGPAVLNLPNFGLVQDGSKCGNNKICMNKQCVSVSVLPPLKCPGTVDNVICSGRGVCTQKGTCFCDEGWTGSDCTVKYNITMTTGVLRKPTLPTTPTTTLLKVTQLSTALTTTTIIIAPPVAVVKADESGISTEWLVIILASVVGSLVFLLAVTFLCYRRTSPVKKRFFGKGNKSIKFGATPSYKHRGLFGKKKKGTSEEESDIGELPPPPVIISDPNSAMPERGILKNNRKSSDGSRSSDTYTGTGGTDTADQDSEGPYGLETEDDEAEEIQEILNRSKFDPEKSMEALDQIVDSSSFDFVLPSPYFSTVGNCTDHSPTKRLFNYDIPQFSQQTPQRPFYWKNNLSSPPKSRVVRMKNLDELIQQIDRHTIDLSPSPDELQMQISPSTSEDVRSNSTDDRQYHNNHTPPSPLSIASTSTRDTYRPFLNSQWTKYILRRNEMDDCGMDVYGSESPMPQISIPPPMSPLNIRNIYNYAQNSHGRDVNDTPIGSQAGDCGSTHGTTSSRNGYEKSSGYGSEHDPEHFSTDEMSRNQSRSGSLSPPPYSAVIRAGPNKIKLVSAKKLHDTGIGDEDLQKLLQELPKIDSGTFNRHPVKSEASLPPKESDPLLGGHLLDEQETIETAPCIDCSVEEIPNSKLRRKSRGSVNSQLMNISFNQNVEDGECVEVTDNKRNCAIDVNT